MRNGADISIVWVGFHIEGKPALEAICAAGFNVTAVVTLDDESSAQRSGVWQLYEFCEKHSIPLYKVRNINDDDSVALLKELSPTVLCVIGWSQILKSPALQSAEYVIGAHASLLPHNRGSAPINWAIIKGEKTTGNTLMLLSEGVDSGDILSQRSFEITPYDSCRTLYEKVAQTNSVMILEFLKQVCEGRVDRFAQTHTDEDILPRRKPKDGLIDWNKDASVVYDFIRALTKPYPGAFTYYQQQQVILWNVAWAPDASPIGRPGTVATRRYSYTDELCSVDISCKSGCLTVYQVELMDGCVLSGKELIEFFKGFTGFNDG